MPRKKARVAFFAQCRAIIPHTQAKRRKSYFSMKRDSFIFYRSFKDAISDLPNNEKLAVYDAIAEYALNYTEPELTGVAKTIWKLIKPQLEANWRRFQNGCKGKEHGVKGGNPNFAKGKSNPYYPKDNPDITPT